ncbi:MAG: hypothetical protein WD342_00940 [Verrucomicrobiales bacterium]
MKKIKFSCSNCEAKLRVPTHLAGVSAPCPKCGHTITAPSNIDDAVIEEVVSKPRAAARSKPSQAASAASASTGAATAVADAPPMTSESAERLRAERLRAENTPAVDEPSTPRPPENLPAPSESAAPPLAPWIGEPAHQPEAPEQPSASPETPAPPAPSFDETFGDTFGDTPPQTSDDASPPTASPPPVEEESVPIYGEPLDEMPPPLRDFDEPAPDPVADGHTQPIRTIQRPDELPARRDENQGGPGELPRLDVSLAGNDDSDTTAWTPEGASQGRTRVRLPRPGEETHQFSPADFIAPAPGPEPPAAGPAPPTEPEEFSPLPDPGEVDESYTLVEPEAPWEASPETASPTAYAPPEPTETPEPEELSAPAETEEVPGAASGAGEPSDPFPAHWDADRGRSESPDEPSDIEGRESLEEGSFEKLFAQQQAPEVPYEAPRGVESGREPKIETPRAPEYLDSLPPAPRTQSSAATPTAGLEPQPIVREETRSDADVLEEMFGNSRKRKRPGKFTMLMLCVIPALAVIAVTMIIFAGSALGFWGSGPSAADPVESRDGAEESSRNPAEQASAAGERSTGEPPERIDPATEDRAEEEARAARSTTTLPGDTEKPVLIVDNDSPPTVDVSESGDGVAESENSRPAGAASPPSRLAAEEQASEEQASEEQPEPESAPSVGRESAADEPEALSFDERVQRIVNGHGLNPDASSPVDEPFPAVAAVPVETSFTAGEDQPSLGLAEDPGSMASEPANVPESNESTSLSDDAGSTSHPTTESPNRPRKIENYNPPDSFDAPGPNDGALGRTHDVIDAFLRAPDWKARAKYAYQNESLAPAMEEYYKKWPDDGLDRYSLQLFRVEDDSSLGGPYWVYLVSTSDQDPGFPLIIRVEDGKLKVDWEIHAEFFDQHFVKFQEGAIAAPHTFRLVIERMSDYYGSDREAFSGLEDYYVYQINPPYGNLNEFSQYAFVKKDSEVARQLEKVVGLGEDPLAVILTLDYETFPHGERHLVVTDYVTEGWFR